MLSHIKIKETIMSESLKKEIHPGKKTEKKRPSFSFEGFLILSFFSAVTLLAYERVTEKYYGEASILHFSHGLGYLNGHGYNG